MQYYSPKFPIIVEYIMTAIETTNFAYNNVKLLYFRTRLRGWGMRDKGIYAYTTWKSVQEMHTWTIIRSSNEVTYYAIVYIYLYTT